MTAMLHDYRHIWRVAAFERSGGPLKMLALLAGLTWAVGLAFGLVVGLVGLIGAPLHALGPALHFVAGGSAVALMLVWIVSYMPGSVLMHGAPSARLLPRQRRRLLQMAYAGWLLPTGMLALATGTWAVFPMAGLMVLALGLARSGDRVSSLLLLAAWCACLLARSALPDATVGAVSGSAGSQATSALLLAVAWFLLRAQYPVGGDDALQRRVEVAQRVLNGQTDGAGRPVSVLSKGDYLYLLALRRDARLRRPGAMLLHALGPAAHWTVRVIAAILMLLTGLGVRAWFARHGGAASPAFRAFMVQAYWPMAIAASTWPLRTRIGALCGEQSLLRLTPLAGDAALLNRRLAAALLKSGLMHWFVAASGYLVMVWIASNDWAPLVQQAALCCLAGQIALAAVLHNVGRRSRFDWPSAFWCLLPASLEAALVAGLAWWLDVSPWPWIAAAGIVGAAVQSWFGWRRMLAAPPAFPAGRFE